MYACGLGVLRNSRVVTLVAEDGSCSSASVVGLAAAGGTANCVDVACTVSTTTVHQLVGPDSPLPPSVARALVESSVQLRGMEDASTSPVVIITTTDDGRAEAAVAARMAAAVSTPFSAARSQGGGAAAGGADVELVSPSPDGAAPAPLRQEDLLSLSAADNAYSYSSQ